MSPDTPVIVLAFANDRDDYLKMVERERQSVSLSLRAYDDNGRILLRKEENTSVAGLFDLFTHYNDRIAIFHYGGHANGTALQLEAAGEAQLAHAEGLAQLFGRQKALQLVFLNGCATGGQVEALLAAGVKAVIATAVPINDQMATEFAEQFYEGLAHRQTIGRAFDTAKDFIATRYGKTKEIRDTRALNWTGKETAVEAGLTWGLYVRPENAAALEWKLPDVAQQQVIIRGQPISSNPASWLNVNLQAALLKALIAESPQFAKDLQDLRERDDFDERDIPPMIINVFPVPIGEQLRSLFAGDTVDVPRLKQLVFTYEITVKLFCFAVLAQLWDVRIEKPDLKIADEHRAALNSFMTLTAESAPTFDYFKLILTVVRIFKENDVTPFMTECARLEVELTDEPTVAAHGFMEEMRAELRGVIAAEEIASFCEQAEKHLATLLCDLVFVALYRPTTIKNIQITKFRNEPIDYIHTQVALDKVTSDPKDSQKTYKTYTDSGSVILQMKRSDGAGYLNLTPFVIDENALMGRALSKLYFLSHYSAEADTYHYGMVNNLESDLPVSSTNFPRIKSMLDEFKAVVFAP